MNAKQKTSCAIALVAVFITQPIWYYLLFKILQAIGASDLMWFLYWVYLPVGLLLAIVNAIVSSAFDDKAG